jgi:hypothetical protein
LLANKIYVASVDQSIKIKDTNGYVKEWIINDDGNVKINKLIKTRVYRLGRSNAIITGVSYHP